MNLTSLMAVARPSGLWSTLIEWVHSWVGGSYGWTILVLIILVKLVLSPLDYLIKHSSKKSSLVQQKTAPQIAKLRKKYGDNQQMIQQQTNALYKREGYNMYGSCIVMLVNLVLTCVIFFTLFSGLRQLSSYQAIEQYDTLRTTYVSTIESTYGKSFDEYKLAINRINDTENPLTEDEITALNTATTAAQNTVSEKWESVQQNWLWVKNIWVTDGHKSPFPTFDNLKEMAENSKIDEYKNYVYAIEQDSAEATIYNNIAVSIEAETGSWNGYYLLAVISVLLSLASQFLNDLANKNKNKKAQALVDQANPQAKSMGFMKLVVPIMMAIFVITTNAAFGIYVITNSLISTLISFATNAILKAVFKKKQAEVDEFLLKETARQEKKLKAKGVQ